MQTSPRALSRLRERFRYCRGPAAKRDGCTVAVLTIACAGLWLQVERPAVAQGLGVNGANASVRRDAYGRVTYTNPPVSPYVNLGFNPNGLSNYQTLVRPMIDEREALRWQSEILQPSRQTRNDPRDGHDRRDSKAEDSKPGAPGSVRFMHYSHFYGGLR
jgi:hypothetical protein